MSAAAAASPRARKRTLDALDGVHPPTPTRPCLSPFGAAYETPSQTREVPRGPRPSPQATPSRPGGAVAQAAGQAPAAPQRPRPRARRPAGADRFLPSAASEQALHQLLAPSASPPKSNYATGRDYQDRVAQTLLGGSSGGSCGGDTILRFKPAAPEPRPSRAVHSERALSVLSQNTQGQLAAAFRERKQHNAQSAQRRAISSTPEKILDAPDLLDDYYLNLLDWSSTNVVSVALAQIVYLWNAASGSISRLARVDGPGDYISSVRFSADGKHLAIGTNNAKVMVYDVQAETLVRTLEGHLHRVASLAWNGNAQLSSGSRDASVMNHDLRASECTSVLRGHTQEICGLSWSSDGKLLASGSNDNTLRIWDAAKPCGARHVFSQHTAAVKALAWHPTRRHLLASGGGTSDRTIRFWNASTGAERSSIHTGSQVCSLLWSQHDPDELLSSHGFSHNQLTLWSYPSMVKVAELTGHTSRVLHLAAAPDGETVVSGAADETLRFWKVFNPKRKQLGRAAAPPGLRAMGIR